MSAESHDHQLEPARRKDHTMLTRLATITAIALSTSMGTAPLALAEPDPTISPVANAAAPPAPEGAVASEAPAMFTTPEGWELTLAASAETQVAVNPLTTAISSRQYMTGGTFTGTVQGDGDGTLSGGVLEVGYQIGCGITANNVRLAGSLGVTLRGGPLTNLMPTGVAFPMTGNIEVGLKPGEVTSVPVTKKEFKGTAVRVTVNNIHIKIDGCVGQSFLRSYAVLTSKTNVTDDVVAYYGVTKSV